MKSVKLLCTLGLLFSSVGTHAQSGIGGLTGDHLFTLTNTSVPPQLASQAVIPIAQSAAEWAVNFDLTKISESTHQFSIQIPDTGSASGYTSYAAERLIYREHNTGERQWIGRLLPNASMVYPEDFGEIIINNISGRPSGLIRLLDEHYQIYTDANVGTRLARVIVPGTGSDVVHSGTTSGQSNSGSTASGLNAGGKIPAVSNVDVLVLIEDDLMDGGPLEQAIRDKIITEKLNADAVFALSGGSSQGIPINLNIIGMQAIDIDPALHSITCDEFNFCPEYENLVGGVSQDSIEIMNARESTGADLAVLFTEFTPTTTGEFCGLASVPQSLSDDNVFRFSFTMQAHSCTTAQFVFLHEILHNFGAGHETFMGNDFVEPFTDYAFGYDAPSNPLNFTTIMACDTEPGVPTVDNDCLRIFRLSDLDDTFMGLPLGLIDGPRSTDNVRFLRECVDPDIGPCRREFVANRKTLVQGPPNSAPPIVNITSPTESQSVTSIPPTAVFNLAATATDDISISNLAWRIDRVDGNSAQVFFQVQNGSGPDFSTTTNVFQTLGDYRVTAAATDNDGQITAFTRRISVTPPVDLSIGIEQVPFSPIMRVNLTNLDQTQPANNITFRLFARSGDGSGSAEITNLSFPGGSCNGSFNAPLEPLSVTYNCTLQSLSPGASLTIDWDNLCNAILTPRNSPQLIFDGAIISANQSDPANINNSFAGATYYHSVCLTP